MLNNFRVFEELVFFDLWIPDSGFWFPVPDSGFRFRDLDSGFLVLGLHLHSYTTSTKLEITFGNGRGFVDHNRSFAKKKTRSGIQGRINPFLLSKISIYLRLSTLVSLLQLPGHSMPKVRLFLYVTCDSPP